MKILDFPELRQTFEYDCGAKALQAILAYFDIDLNEENIMKEVKTSKKGTSIINIENSAKKYGLKVDSRSMNPDDIKRYIDRNIPVIILLQAWKDEGNTTNWEKDWKDGHYVVAIGYDKDNFYFEDPYKFKRVFLNVNELIERWHDVVDGKKYSNHAMAVWRGKSKFNSKEVIHMD